MVLAGLTYSQLSEILQANGYVVVHDEFWHEHNRIFFKKDNEQAITLQFKGYYKFGFVVTFLTSLGIQPPDHCQKPFDQLKAYHEKNKPTGLSDGGEHSSG